MKETTNFKFKLPEDSDIVTPAPFNENFTVIDRKLKTIETDTATKAHTHGAGELTGILPVQKGGTGQGSAAGALAALITGAGALNAANLSVNDVIGVADVSVAGGGKKVTVGDLLAFSNQNMNGAKFVLGSWTGTGLSGETHQNTITTPFPAKYIWVVGSRRKDSNYMEAPNFYYDEIVLFLPEIMPTSFDDSYRICFYGLSQGGWMCPAKKSVDGKTMQWYYPYSNDVAPAVQGNDSGTTYYYIALG